MAKLSANRFWRSKHRLEQSKKAKISLLRPKLPDGGEIFYRFALQK
jgi:hypothetical protein